MHTTTVTVHIIANHEIGMTECGILVDYHNASDPTPWGVPSDRSSIAIWDNDMLPMNGATCAKCSDEYNK